MRTDGHIERNYFIRMHNFETNQSVTISRFNAHFQVNEHEKKVITNFGVIDNAIKYCMEQGYSFHAKSIFITGN